MRWRAEMGRQRRSLTRILFAGLGYALLLPAGVLAQPAIRVDLESFWYERTPPPVPISESGPNVLGGAGERVLAAVSSVLHHQRDDFPQPPPLEIVVRAHPREALEEILGIVAESTSYGGTTLEGSTVYIDVHRSVFVGWRALNDAELRSFIGHELVHAYQFGSGVDPGRGPELWRRELEAYIWEIQHMETAVRPWYREDSLAALHFYVGLLRDP